MEGSDALGYSDLVFGPNGETLAGSSIYHADKNHVHAIGPWDVAIDQKIRNLKGPKIRTPDDTAYI